MADDHVTSAALAARRGDEAAAEIFVRATQATVWLLHANLVSREEADDLTQETYLRAFRALPGFRGEASARTWLLTIARRTAVDHLRSRGRRPLVAGSLDASGGISLSPAAHADGVGPVAAARGDLADAVVLRQLVAGLEPDRRTAFVLTQMLGLSYAEAAEVCGCPVGTIRSRVARARDDLISGYVDESTQSPAAR